jgi:uncharacterized protein YndB with AHSA1/START domain
MSERVELQREIDAAQVDVFRFVATSDGLRSWLDDADLEPRVGGRIRLRLRDGVAVGKVLSIAEPQHISFTWDWANDPLASLSVVAFDVIDHGARTHFTVRHVGLPGRRQVELHEELWRFWLERLIQAVARRLPDRVDV